MLQRCEGLIGEVVRHRLIAWSLQTKGQETKPRTPQARTAEEKCLQKIRGHVFSSLKLVEPFCCVAQSRMAQSGHAGQGAGPVSDSFWIQWWQQQHCRDACSKDNRWVKFPLQRNLLLAGPSAGKTRAQRWSSASSLSVEGTLRDCPPLSLPQQWLSQ